MAAREARPEDSYRIAELAEELTQTVESLQRARGRAAHGVSSESREDVAVLLETLIALLDPLKATHLDAGVSLRIPPVLVERLRDEREERGQRAFWREVPRVVRHLREDQLADRDVKVLERVADAVDREVLGDLARATHR